MPSIIKPRKKSCRLLVDDQQRVVQKYRHLKAFLEHNRECLQLISAVESLYYRGEGFDRAEIIGLLDRLKAETAALVESLALLSSGGYSDFAAFPDSIFFEVRKRIAPKPERQQLPFTVPLQGLASQSATVVGSKATFLTFGGAYAVLPYIAQAGVEQYSWLTAEQMMDGLGLAETTPGPLIMVVQFVGFMAGWNHPGALSPVMGATIGSLVATYFTFLPGFLFIFLGAPYIEKFRENVKLSTTLSGITAAVVGVVLNLAVWFGMQVMFVSKGEINWFGAAVGLASFIALQWTRLGIISVILLSGGLGLAWYVIF